MWLVWIWVLIAVLALFGESISLALFLLNVAVAAAVAAILAAFGIVLGVQIGVFAVLSVLLIGVARPRLLNLLAGRNRPLLQTEQTRLIDREATVVQTVTDESGTIRVGAGEFWSARAYPPTQRIGVGSRVRIAYVSGLIAYVRPAEQESGPQAGLDALQEPDSPRDNHDTLDVPTDER